MFVQFPTSYHVTNQLVPGNSVVLQQILVTALKLDQLYFVNNGGSDTQSYGFHKRREFSPNNRVPKYLCLYERQNKDFHHRNKCDVAKDQLAMALNSTFGYSLTNMSSGNYVRSLTLPKLE